MGEYIDGPLANPTPDVRAAAASASIHNMHAERSLGMVDALKKRAPNADIDFLDAKARCQLNKTLDWFANQSKVDQKEMISFCVKQGRRVRQERGVEKKKVKEVKFVRQKEKVRHFDVKERNKLSNEVRVMLRDEGVLDMGKFSLSDDQIEKVNCLLLAVDKPKGSISFLVEHYWWCNESKKDVLWKGNVLLLKRNEKKDIHIRISYWRPDVDDPVPSVSSLISYSVRLLQT